MWSPWPASERSAMDPKRKKNLLFLLCIFLFALALAAFVIFLMVLRGPAVAM
jgi:flagellar basal body-associated protein FliL